MPDRGVLLSLENRVAIVTGGSRGIGAAIVRLFTQAGARVLFKYQRAQNQAGRLAEECGGAKTRVGVKADLSSIEAARSLVTAATDRFGRVDIVVGNHGVWPPRDTPISEMPDEQWRSTVAINLHSIFGLVKHGVAPMKQPGYVAHAVLLSSTAGQRGEAYHGDYAV